MTRFGCAGPCSEGWMKQMSDVEWLLRRAGRSGSPQLTSWSPIMAIYASGDDGRFAR